MSEEQVRCYRCGGPTKYPDDFVVYPDGSRHGAHRNHINCIDHLTQVQAELCKALDITLSILRDVWQDNPQHPILINAKRALAKAKGETPNG
jgi:hypothetical protein